MKKILHRQVVEGQRYAPQGSAGISLDYVKSHFEAITLAKCVPLYCFEGFFLSRLHSLLLWFFLCLALGFGCVWLAAGQVLSYHGCHGTGRDQCGDVIRLSHDEYSGSEIRPFG